MKVLIAGAGYVGAVLAKELRDRGDTVVALRRRPEPLGEGITTLAANLFDASALALPKGLDAIVYCAAADGSTESDYRRAYIDGVSNVLAASDAARFVFTSSTAVYAQDDGSVVDEASEVTPKGNARFLLEGEALVRARGGTILRLAGIYGPGRDRIVRMVNEGTARLGSGAFGNRIHQADCAGAVAHVLSLASPLPIYVGVDHAPDPLDDVYRWVAQQLGRPEPERGEPDARARGTGRKRCSSALLRASGYAFRVPSYREGYAPAIAALRGPS